MSAGAVVALPLALASTILTNVAYSREHDAAAAMPPLRIREPLRSLRLLVGDRPWMTAFLLESSGFALYAAALALGPLALVQSVAAGGIGVLAYVSARRTGRALGGLELAGVCVSVLGLLALGISLAAGGAEGVRGEAVPILLWLGATAALAALALYVGPALLGRASACGIAGGLLFSIGDISTKLATEGGARFAFLATLVLGYALGTALLQAGYQAGGAVAVAGVATLLTNALPIAAGTVLLHEPVPAGALGALRALAFVAVTAGAVLLSRPPPAPASPTRGAGGAALSEATGGN